MAVCAGNFPADTEVVYWEENDANTPFIPKLVSGEIQCKYPWYVIGSDSVFITLSKDPTRFYHRFKKGVDELYSVKDAISYI
jgi:hypothetical protein